MDVISSFQIISDVPPVLLGFFCWIWLFGVVVAAFDGDGLVVLGTVVGGRGALEPDGSLPFTTSCCKAAEPKDTLPFGETELLASPVGFDPAGADACGGLMPPGPPGPAGPAGL